MTGALPSITTVRSFTIAVCLASCSSNPGPAHPETPAPASAAATAPAEPAAPTAPAEPAGSSLQGAAIDAWFRQRGAKTPGSLNLEDARCETLRAPVPSGQALSCEAHSAIRPWVRTSRRILFDVRNGRTLVLVNLISSVAPFDAPSGSGGACAGALAALRVQVSADAKALTVADEPGCGCEQAEKLLAGNSGDPKALELQAREVKQACAQRGAYVWGAHGFEPARGE